MAVTTGVATPASGSGNGAWAKISQLENLLQKSGALLLQLG